VTAAQARHRAVVSAITQILRAERERQGLSMNALATRAGLSQQMVSYVEREMRNPTLDTVLRMTGALGVNLADVINAANRRVDRHKK